MDYEKLTSDKVNYVIWRYLQEAGFNQTAARLQLDWDKPYPEQLGCAKYIQPRALITLIQQGLKLHRLKARDPSTVQPFFGPDTDVLNGSTEATTTATTTTTTTIAPAIPSRTNPSSPIRRLDNNAPAVSVSAPSSTSKPRNRRSNNNGAQSSATTTTTTANGKPRGTASTSITGAGESMDVDQLGGTVRSEHDMDIDGDVTKEDHSPSSISSPARNGELQNVAETLENGAAAHLEQQRIPTPIPTPTLTNGISTGIQSEKPIDLTSRTTMFDSSSLRYKIATHAALAKSQNRNTSLALGGKKLFQIWEISQDRSGSTATNPSATENGETLLNPTLSAETITDLMNDEDCETVHSIAWDPSGEYVAWSSHTELDNPHGKSIVRTRSRRSASETRTDIQLVEPITNLNWNESGRLVIGLSGTILTLIDRKMPQEQVNCNVHHNLFDSVWIKENQFILCGEGYVGVGRHSNGTVEVDSFPSDDIVGSTCWTSICFDEATDTCVIASDVSGEVARINKTGDNTKQKVHNKGITDIKFSPNREGTDSRLLATSSMDNTIKIWDTSRGLNLERTFDLPRQSIWRLSWNPDGSMLAVTDEDQVLIWRIDQEAGPQYSWETRHIKWQSFHLTNGDTPHGMNGHDHDMEMDDIEEDGPKVVWTEINGQLLFVNKDKVAYINLPG